MIIRKHFFLSGHVQGVGLRYRCYYIAKTLDLTGWVRNLWDGRVELELQGEEKKFDQFFIKLEQNRYISIEQLHSTDMEIKQEKGFTIWD